MPPLVIDVLLPAFTTLFVVIDPPGLAPLFLALTRGASQQERRTVAVRSCVTAIIVLMLFGLFGDKLLGFMGIGMPAFRIAGGLMLFLIAVEMLFEKRTERRSRSAAEAHPDSDATGAADTSHGSASSHADDVAIFPLGIPLIAGPGAIASVILLMSGNRGDYVAQAGVMAVTVTVVALVFVVFLMAGRIERLTGPTVTTVMTRVFGIILGALAVQFVLSGLAGSQLIAG